MAIRFYLVPKIGTGAGADDAFRPKYIADTSGITWQAMDYGLEDTFLVAAEVTPDQHVTINSNIDVTSVPQNIDATIGLTALSAVQNALEGLHIPADWVTTNNTYRDVLRVVGKAFMFMQRYHGINLAKFFIGGITLDTRINQLTQAQRDKLQAAADSLGLNTSTITGPTLIRQALKILADQLPAFSLTTTF